MNSAVIYFEFDSEVQRDRTLELLEGLIESGVMSGFYTLVNDFKPAAVPMHRPELAELAELIAGNCGDPEGGAL